ncbi:hypothetical protein PVNG_02211 [Plasmodium vivax North Korean]|uniref:Variable surface protein n=1 Tax=Plasmodium vivax North Korean TaxID=1035514 RepID=A0A0J9WDQ7_PLAVI|nr:hypothetical protein PVNG_02211 [Plasmodium vivax North Korean]
MHTYIYNIKNFHYHKLILSYIIDNNYYSKNIEKDNINVIYNYPFLKNVWTTYKNFDNIREDEKRKYAFICDSYILNRLTRIKSSYREFCIKLIRNLGHYDVNSIFFNPSHDDCNILYNWIYNRIENPETANELIVKCFDDYINLMKPVPGKHKCSYDLFNSTYLEPRKITILKIFDSSMSDIIVKLNEKYSSTDIPSQNFVCECVKIYKELKKDHCTEASRTDKHVQTCEMLESFKKSYMQVFYNFLVKTDNIPSLDDVEKEYLEKCTTNRGILKIRSSRDNEQAGLPQSASVGGEESTEVQGPYEFSTSSTVGVEKPGNPISSTVSTTIGTVAGASSILALLYKVTLIFI